MNINCCNMFIYLTLFFFNSVGYASDEQHDRSDSMSQIEIRIRETEMRTLWLNSTDILYIIYSMCILHIDFQQWFFEHNLSLENKHQVLQVHPTIL